MLPAAIRSTCAIVVIFTALMGSHVLITNMKMGYGGVSYYLAPIKRF